MRFRSWCVLSFAGLLGAGATGAQTPTLNDEVSRSPVLLELFTSEGCSSCPPADALLGQLNGRSNSSGHMLIVLSEHVTYWNHQGWTDPYSSEVYTERQSAYGRRFRLESVYTPQLVINGNEEVVGSDRAAVKRAVDRQRLASGLSIRIVSATAAAGSLSLTYSVEPGPKVKGELFAAITDDTDSSRVLHGENGGRTLSHVAVVRSLVRIGSLGEAVPKGQVTIPISTARRPAPQHVVLFAQEAGFGRVLDVSELPVTRE